MATSSGSSGGFPTPAERNRQLARRLREAFAAAAGDSGASYEGIKRKAALYRAGQLEAQELCAGFFAALGGRTPEAEDLYREMAELLPTPALYGELMEALRASSGGDGNSSDGPSSSRQWQEEAQQRQQSLGRGQRVVSAGPLEALPSGPVGASSRGDPRQTGPNEPSRAGSAAPTAASAPLFLLDAIHPNSQSARPAKPLPAAKRARNSCAAAALHAPAKADTGGAGRARGVVLWLRQDLRLHDHPALCAAAADATAGGGTVTLVYVHSPAEDGDEPASGNSWRPGAASLLWAHGALAALDADLRRRYGGGAGIVYRRGPAAAALAEVSAGVGAGRVYFSRRYEPAMQASDARIQAALEAAGLGVRSFPGYLLREPEAVRLDMGKWAGHFGTLMPFVRACEALGPLGAPLAAPTSLPVASRYPADRCGGLTLEALGLARMPVRRDGSVVDWGAPIRAAWGKMSEAQALRLLDDFLAAGLARYESDRGFADGRCVSRLSPFLHFGQLSPRLMMQRLQAANCKQVSKTFWRRLAWRDLAYWQLHHWPRMAAHPIRPHYAAQEWAHAPAALAAWRRGATGFPLVDAGMRELWATGWMQQNARMAAACLLTEYLNISWVEGARWFHDTLVDADLAINSMMWANAGKAGLDQWNFTVLPTSRAQDPTGAYIRRWVPELAQLPGKHLHEPWKAPPAVLAAAGVELGRTYPRRLTTRDWQELRAVNTAAICAARVAGGPGCVDSQGYDLIIVPQGATLAHDGRRMRVFTKQEYRGGGSGRSGGSGGTEVEEGGALAAPRSAGATRRGRAAGAGGGGRRGNGGARPRAPGSARF